MRFEPDSEKQEHALELEEKLRSKLKELLPFASYVAHFKSVGSKSPHVRMQQERNAGGFTLARSRSVLLSSYAAHRDYRVVQNNICSKG